MKYATVEDLQHGTIRLAEENIDIVRGLDGEWSGENADQVNRLQKSRYYMLTWPKQITEIVFSNDQGFSELIASRPANPNDPRDVFNHEALKKGTIMPVFGVIIKALPGTRMVAKYLHEIL